MRSAWTVRLVVGIGMTVLLYLSAGAAQRGGAPAGDGKRWFKGNLHTHTLNSDGDSTPLEVATWYREHGYHFLVLSDHNYLTEVAGLNATVGAPGQFLLMPGEEVTDQFERKPIHVNAYNPKRFIEPQGGSGVVATIQNNVNEIRRAGALPSLNHPNFGWAVTPEELLQVTQLPLFEVYNGHPMVNNRGGGGFASLDEMWDLLLSNGRRIYGIAVDDAHVFKRFGKDLSNPGHGWIWVRAAELTTPAIMAAIEAGDFYASSGVKLASVSVSAESYRVTLDLANWERASTYFIGDGGKVLGRSFDKEAVYNFRGGEKYVRARVESSSGFSAWTQPAFLDARVKN
jgi:hypothetical protein